MNKRIYVFAGPNGSGKSTVIQNFLEQGICPEHYICPDNLVQKNKKNDEDAYLKAMQDAEDLRNALIKAGDSFTFETVLSTRGKIDFLLRAKEIGYKITTIYIITPDYNINIKRVEARVKDGGHDVPTDKLISRYNRCMTLIKDVIEISDEVKIYDNSTRPVQIFIKTDDGEMILLNREQRHSFYDKYFLDNHIEISKDLTCLETDIYITVPDSADV